MKAEDVGSTQHCMWRTLEKMFFSLSWVLPDLGISSIYLFYFISNIISGCVRRRIKIILFFVYHRPWKWGRRDVTLGGVYMWYQMGDIPLERLQRNVQAGANYVVCTIRGMLIHCSGEHHSWFMLRHRSGYPWVGSRWVVLFASFISL